MNTKAADVWRWEKPDGDGPYTGGWDDWSRHTRFNEVPHNDDTGRPTPQQDGLKLRITSSHRYGFASIRQEGQWFRPRERWQMLLDGFNLVRYSGCIGVEHGHRQSIFLSGTLTDVVCPFRRMT